jgi:ureidoglycolate lyase
MASATSPRQGIRLEPLTREAFAPFGDVLETDAVVGQLINCGHTQKFGKLAQVAVGEGGIAQLSIYRSRALVLPFRIQRVECHPLGSQAFYPLHQRPFPVVVARPGEAPGPADLRVFLSNGRQGVNLHPGVWHHYQLSLGQDSDYLVIDRAGEGDNYLEQRFEEEVWLVI